MEESVPIFLAFDNVGVEISDRVILKNVCGRVKPGEMLAVMGPSGSGKTTLLNVLAGRLKANNGDILLNGNKLQKKQKKKICYVLQEDIFFEHLTLRETLTFSARLRLPDTLSKAEKLQKVEEIVDTLDVRKCLDTAIGSPLERGLSGGEKKRASIGCELITNPSMIFLDEPTSGLDSSTALSLVKTLKSFGSSRNKTIVATIHQPSSQIFRMFDKLLLLCSGQVAYYGKAQNVLDFFESIGLVCDAHFNPADFILEKITEGRKTEDMIVKKWTERWSRRKISQVTPSEIQPVIRSPVEKEKMVNIHNTEGNTEYHGSTPKHDMMDDNEADEEEPHTDDEVTFPEGSSDVKSQLLVPEMSGTGKLEANGDLNSDHRALLIKPEAVVEDDEDTTKQTCLKRKKNKSHDRLPGEHVTVQLETQVSGEFSGVSLVSFVRSASRDYTKVDVFKGEWEEEEEDEDSGGYGQVSTTWMTSYWTQFSVLTHRTFKQSMPEILSKLSLIQTLVLALVCSLIWYQLPYNEDSIRDRSALIFFCMSYWHFNTTFLALLSFGSERAVVNKERLGGYYRLSAYYFAKMLSQLPLIVLQPTLFLTIIYWMCGLNNSAHAYLGSLFMVLLTALTGQSVGLLISALIAEFKKSIVIASLFTLTCMLLGGFYQEHIPPWLDWFKYFSYITFSFEGSLLVEFQTSRPYQCRVVESAYDVCRNNGTAVIRGSDILKNLDVTSSLGTNVAVLLLYIVFFRSLTYLSLRYLNKPM